MSSLSHFPLSQQSQQSPTFQATRILTPIPPSPGNLRQRPPRRLAARRLLGQVHFHGGRVGRPQALLYALVEQRPVQLALGILPQRRHPPDAGRGHWRDQRPRRRRQGQDPGPGDAREGPERAVERYSERAGFPAGEVPPCYFFFFLPCERVRLSKEFQELTNVGCRNAKPSSAINPRAPTRVWSDGS